MLLALPLSWYHKLLTQHIMKANSGHPDRYPSLDPLFFISFQQFLNWEQLFMVPLSSLRPIRVGTQFSPSRNSGATQHNFSWSLTSFGGEVCEWKRSDFVACMVREFSFFFLEIFIVWPVAEWNVRLFIIGVFSPEDYLPTPWLGGGGGRSPGNFADLHIFCPCRKGTCTYVQHYIHLMGARFNFPSGGWSTWGFSHIQSNHRPWSGSNL